MSPAVPGIAAGIGADLPSSRFSTTVENYVENSGLSRLAVMKILVLSGSAYGEGLKMAIFPTVFGF